MDDAWYAKAQGCKIGTVPMVVQLHGGDKLEAGRWVRVKRMPGAAWQRVLVNRVDDDGHFQADQ